MTNKKEKQINISTMEDDDNNLENLREWLHDNFEPWDSIKSVWEKTCTIRRNCILKNDFEKVLQLWPRYKKSIGYELVDIDFKHLYPGSTSSYLKHYFYNFADKIIKLALDEARDRKDKDAIDRFNRKSPVIDEENNFLGCVTLAAIFYMVPNKNKKCKQSLDKMFHKVPKGNMINEEIQRVSEKAATLKEDMNPFILYYENESCMPYKFFVSVNHLIYETSNFITALDILFKCYFVFNVNYPSKCINVLTFLQHFFYKIFLKSDVNSTSIFSFMCDVDIERGLECEKIIKEIK